VNPEEDSWGAHLPPEQRVAWLYEHAERLPIQDPDRKAMLALAGRFQAMIDRARAATKARGP
jgi:hypothetical protein